MRPAPESAEAWQREVLNELRAIRAALEQHRRPAAVSKADRVTLERLLPAVATVFGLGELFTSREVIAHPAPGLRVLRKGLSTKQIGRLFTRAEGTPIGGFKVEHVGTEINVCLWRVVTS